MPFYLRHLDRDREGTGWCTCYIARDL
jgi:hypothetical protein